MKQLINTAAILAGLALPLSLSANDPVKVDGKHYKVEFETDSVRVLRIQYGPGESSVMHTHPEGVAIYLTDAETAMMLPDGTTVPSKGKAGSVQPAPAGAHLPKNTGSRPMELVLVELKGKPAASDTAADLARMKTESLTWFDHYAKADGRGMAALYAEDALLMPPGAPAVRGRAAIQAFLGDDAAKTKAAGITLKNTGVTGAGIAGDTGWISGSYTVHDGSGATIDSGSYLSIHQRTKGAWLYIRDTWNSDRPSAPAP